GHMPFSHDFEHALELWASHDGDVPAHVAELLEPEPGADKPHEKLGIGIVNQLRHKVDNDTDATDVSLGRPIRFSFKLAATILEAPTTGGVVDPVDRAVSWLH